MTDQGRATFEAAKAMFGHMAIGLNDLEWRQLPSAVTEHLKMNPGTTTLQLSCLLVIVIPGVMATPALLGLGFGSGGPMAGWLAAAFQSMYGTPLAFSTLQSAAMGGWGVAIVNSIIQASATVVGIVTEVLRWKSKN
ncbi:hypothetical protein M409DRAFT_61365 [Zasmidium cellare ATCC 36951]|uniref:Uncharacterized protein n=1 Tax=Zasmidium cellare ATCC 36951 TaxID=1080233 RepID=A0A6A6BVF4_ZASCE|nr:uncharacterized protein M409DRAFT_61365 [Zasmidium cellare ATCC 36951]KAF2158777.1 hypothetical protein M409DRAFT_61365 [Zasmidium cellare ATCC 36951]